LLLLVSSPTRRSSDLHPGVDKVSFTGSTEVGKMIVRAATGNLKRVSLELGGKSPVIIFPDADLDRTIDGAAQFIFGNTGQNCGRSEEHTSELQSRAKL